MFPLFWFVGTSPVCHNLSNSVDSTLAPWEGPIWFLFMPQHVLHMAWKIAFSRQLLNSSKERNSTISMGVLCQNLAHLTAKCFPNSYNIIIFFPGEKKCDPELYHAVQRLTYTLLTLTLKYLEINQEVMWFFKNLIKPIGVSPWVSKWWKTYW